MRRLGETLAAVALVAVFVWWAAGLAFGGTGGSYPLDGPPVADGPIVAAPGHTG